MNGPGAVPGLQLVQAGRTDMGVHILAIGGKEKPRRHQLVPVPWFAVSPLVHGQEHTPSQSVKQAKLQAGLDRPGVRTGTGKLSGAGDHPLARPAPFEQLGQFLCPCHRFREPSPQRTTDTLAVLWSCA